MKENYVNLCAFNYGKYSYTVVKNGDKVVYFESVNGKYVMPIINFNLYDNEGKSLTLVNQHFFMSQLINRVNVALKKGYFSNDNDIINYLSDIKAKTENDGTLKKLFKGSMMQQIDEANFESNKKEILSYLDRFRYDTFVSYNNVSIFEGSLEKDQSSDNQIEVLDDNQNTESSDDLYEVIDDELVNDSEQKNDISDDFNPVSDNVFDLSEVNDNIDSVDSNDYFSSLDSSSLDVHEDSVVESINSDSNIDESVINNVQNDILNNVDVVDSIESDNLNNLNENQIVSNEFNLFNNIQGKTNLQDNNVQVSSGLNDVSVSFQNIDNDVQNDFYSQQNDVQNNTLSYGLGENQDNSNISYIDEVKDRLSSGYNGISSSNSSQISNESVNENLDFSAGNVTLGDSVISDKNELPELEKVSDVPVESDNNSKKKGHLGVVIFMIIFVLVLCALSFYLYNYVF